MKSLIQSFRGSADFLRDLLDWQLIEIISLDQFSILLHEKGHQRVGLGLQVTQAVALKARPTQHSLVVNDPPKQTNQQLVLTVLLDLLKIWENDGLYLLLVLVLEQLQDGKVLRKAGYNVVVYVDKVLGSKLGPLDHIEQLLSVSQFPLKSHLDGLNEHLLNPRTHHSLLAPLHQRRIERLHHLHCCFEGLGPIFGQLDAVIEAVEHPVEELSFEIVNLNKLLPHYGSLPLPRGVLQQGVSQLEKACQFFCHCKVFGLVFGPLLEQVHFGLHINEVGKLLHHFADIALEDLQGQNVLHVLMKRLLLLPGIPHSLSAFVSLFHVVVGLEYSLLGLLNAFNLRFDRLAQLGIQFQLFLLIVAQQEGQFFRVGVGLIPKELGHHSLGLLLDRRLAIKSIQVHLS